MNAVKLIVVVVLALCGVLFLWQNQPLLDQHLPVRLRLPLIEIRPMPPDGPRIDLMLVASFAFGFLVAYLLGLWRRIRSGIEIRRLRKQVSPVAEPASRGVALARRAPVSAPPSAPPAPADDDEVA